MNTLPLSASERLAEVARQHAAAHALLKESLDLLATECRQRLHGQGFAPGRDIEQTAEFDAMGYWSRTRHDFVVVDQASGLSMDVAVLLSSHFEQHSLLHVVVLRAQARHGELTQKSKSTQVRVSATDSTLAEQIRPLRAWLLESPRVDELFERLEQAVTP